MITNDSQMTGAIGESLVVAELIKKGWVAIELNREVKGPYVFVSLDKDNNPDYYILSRSQFIKLLYSLSDRYCNKIQHEKPLNLSLPAELHLRLLQGNDGRPNKGLPGFKNPFPGNIFHNAWENIWKD